LLAQPNNTVSSIAKYELPTLSILRVSPNGGLRNYALQAHFDFCVTDSNHRPAFAIEYDGGGHDSKNDRKKTIFRLPPT
jgi:hypothetical protein